MTAHVLHLFPASLQRYQLLPIHRISYRCMLALEQPRRNMRRIWNISAAAIVECSIAGRSAAAQQDHVFAPNLWPLRSKSLTPQVQANPSYSHLRGGRAVGLLMLLVGVALLVYVFMQSYGMLTHPIPGMALPSSGHAAASSANAASTIDFGRLGSAAIAFLLKLAVLLIMTFVGSVIAARGVHLYYVASGTTERPSSGIMPTAAIPAVATAGNAPSLSISDAPADPSVSRLAGGQRQ